MSNAERVAGLIETALLETAPEGALYAVNLTPSSWRVVLAALRTPQPEERRIHENAVYQEFLHRAFTQDYASDFIDAAKARDKQQLPQVERS